MKSLATRVLGGLLVAVCLWACVAACGCKTPQKIDWNSRIGSYTYDQAVLELGPPDRYAKLTDETVVAEWLTRRSASHLWLSYTYGYGYYAVHPTYIYTQPPERYLRLTFGPDGKLKAWKKFYR